MHAVEESKRSLRSKLGVDWEALLTQISSKDEQVRAQLRILSCFWGVLLLGVSMRADHVQSIIRKEVEAAAGKNLRETLYSLRVKAD